MKTSLSILFRSMPSLFALSMVLLSTSGMAATTAYMSTTEYLDLSRVQFVVVASTELKEPLRNRAMALFTKAGLPLPASQASQIPSLAVLMLTLDPRPLGDTCPGKALYAPSLALTEPVTIPRTAALIHDTTWLLGTHNQIREPIEGEQIEMDLDGFINQFIVDYKAAKCWRQSQERSATPDVDGEQRLYVSPSIPERHADRDLRDIRTVSVSVFAGQWSSALKTNAGRQLSKAGLRISPDPAENGVLALSLELTQRSLGDQCPGKVLYARGLYLVEQAQLTRRPRVSLWSDTGLQESAQIVPPLSLQELESDQYLLLQEFIRLRETK